MMLLEWSQWSNVEIARRCCVDNSTVSRVRNELSVGIPQIEPQQRNGTVYTHGHRRTNGDKRRAVMMLLRDDEWSQWSNVEIAKRCCVGETLVRSMRNDVSSLKTKIEPQQRKVERNGTVYTQDTTNIGKAKAEPQADIVDIEYMPPTVTVRSMMDTVDSLNAMYLRKFRR